MTELDIEQLASFCKRKGLIYPSGDIYGGMKGFYDYGPYGVEIKRNLTSEWWTTFIQQPEDVIGLDGSIITHPDVWRASGHVDSFSDLILESQDGSYMVRADHFLEDELGGDYDGVSPSRVDELIEEHGFTAPNGKAFKPCQPFNLMFHTQIGPKQDSSSEGYLRPETAQLIFTNFKYAKQNGRQKLPFGIGQIGKAFRNEISPRNFVFRGREFEQMEIEHFVHPLDDDHQVPTAYRDQTIKVLTAESQTSEGNMEEQTVGDLLEEGLLTTWHAHYIGKHVSWLKHLGLTTEKLRIREHLEDELAHYSQACWDLEYQYTFGWQELMGVADRSDHDLSKHMEHSGTKLNIHDHNRGEKVMPHVAAEPSMGVDRAFLAFIDDAYEEDEERGNVVLHLHPRIAPNTVAVFPLVKNNEELRAKAREVYRALNTEFKAFWDERGSVGKRYARQDELGTPYCVTVDFDTLEDEAVTIRDRDTTEQVRVNIADLKAEIASKIRQH